MAALAAAAVTSEAGVAAEQEDEMFEILDDNFQPIGLQPRGVAHSLGLLHRAVYCFIFNVNKELLIQKRSAKKKVGPNQWDLSVAEHLQPGETYKEAILRGLKEELGILITDCQGPLAPAHQRRLIVPGIVDDHEVVESYYISNFEGSVHFNSEEVAQVEYMAIADIQSWMLKAPEDFTQWFRQELESLNFFVGFQG